MLTKKGINTVREEKHISGVGKRPRPDREASSAPSMVKQAVACSQCGGRFEKSCSSDYLCDVMNTKCPKCGGNLG
jgi:hypothetical protein